MTTIDQGEVDRIAKAAVEAVVEDFAKIHGPLPFMGPEEFRILAGLVAGVTVHMIAANPGLLEHIRS